MNGCPFAESGNTTCNVLQSCQHGLIHRTAASRDIGLSTSIVYRLPPYRLLCLADDPARGSAACTPPKQCGTLILNRDPDAPLCTGESGQDADEPKPAGPLSRPASKKDLQADLSIDSSSKPAEPRAVARSLSGSQKGRLHPIRHHGPLPGLCLPLLSDDIWAQICHLCCYLCRLASQTRTSRMVYTVCHPCCRDGPEHAQVAAL